MVRQTGDLWPSVSGGASLGVDQVNGMGGFTNEIRPFSHVHQLSGVFHNSRGGSGIIRYGLTELEKSDDGGITYTAFGAGGVGTVDLEEAYSNGNEIDLNVISNENRGVLIREVVTALPGPNSADFITDQKDYGIAVSGFTLTPLNAHSYGFTRIGPQAITITASGQPGGTIVDIPTTIFLGFNETGFRNIANISTSGSLTIAAGTTSADVLTLDSEGSLAVDIEGTSTATSSSMNWTTNDAGGTTFTANDGDISLTSAPGGIGDPNEGLGGQIKLVAFAGSGQLRYLFGPFEAWHTSPSHTSDFFPLPHSGQVLEMIEANSLNSINGEDGPDIGIAAGAGITVNTASDTLTIINDGVTNIRVIGDSSLTGPITVATNASGFMAITQPAAAVSLLFAVDHLGLSGLWGFPTNGVFADSLQRAYEGGNTIDTVRVFPGTSTNNNLDVTIASGKFIVDNNEYLPHLNLAGTLFPPSGSVDGTYPNLPDTALGDLTMFTHNVVDGDIVDSHPLVLNEPLKDARSLGLGTLALNTGSGIINVSIGSGIAQFFNTAIDTITTSDLNIRFSNGGNTFKDSHYMRVGTLHPNGAGIVILAPGCYRVNYASSSIKTVGTTPQTVQARAVFNGSTDINGSRSFSLHFDSTNNSENTANGVFMFDADAGDHIALVVSLAASPGGNTVTTNTRNSNMVIEYIGPKRGTTNG